MHGILCNTHYSAPPVLMGRRCAVQLIGPWTLQGLASLGEVFALSKRCE